MVVATAPTRTMISIAEEDRPTATAKRSEDIPA